jgi:hypothetical protein
LGKFLEYDKIKSVDFTELPKDRGDSSVYLYWTVRMETGESEETSQMGRYLLLFEPFEGKLTTIMHGSAAAFMDLPIKE